MTDIAIKVENLSKMYRIGVEESHPQTAAQTTRSLVTSPFSYLRRMMRPPTEEETLWALNDVSFEIKRGEVVGIIGPNGAGKSTLLKILSRITEPTSGWAEIRGRVGSLLEVGTGFHPELTGRENIYLSGALLGMRREEINRQFDEIVDFSGVEKFIDTPVKRYSSGMNVRLGFAVAAYLEPEVLLVDEVLAVGDIAFQRKCLGKMNNVVDAGRTVVFVSHNMPAVRNLCRKSLLLIDGTVHTNSDTEIAINNYLDLFGETQTTRLVLPNGNPDAPGFATSLQFIDKADRPAQQFKIGEIWHVILNFTITKITPHVIGAIGLLTQDGFPIITYWSYPSDLSPGNYQIKFTIDLPLASGVFRFSIGLSSNDVAFYVVHQKGQIKISDIAIGDQPHRSSKTALLVNEHRPNIEEI